MIPSTRKARIAPLCVISRDATSFLSCRDSWSFVYLLLLASLLLLLCCFIIGCFLLEVLFFGNNRTMAYFYVGAISIQSMKRQLIIGKVSAKKKQVRNKDRGSWPTHWALGQGNELRWLDQWQVLRFVDGCSYWGPKSYLWGQSIKVVGWGADHMSSLDLSFPTCTVWL